MTSWVTVTDSRAETVLKSLREEGHDLAEVALALTVSDNLDRIADGGAKRVTTRLFRALDRLDDPEWRSSLGLRRVPAEVRMAGWPEALVRRALLQSRDEGARESWVSPRWLRDWAEQHESDTPIPVSAEVRAHLGTLLEVPGASAKIVAQVSGVDTRAVQRAASRTGLLSSFMQTCLLGTSPARVFSAIRSLPVRHGQAVVEALESQGFQRTHIASAADMTGSALYALMAKRPTAKMHRHTYDRLRALDADVLCRHNGLASAERPLEHLRGLAQEIAPDPLAKHLHMSTDRLQRLLNAPVQWIDAETELRILATSPKEVDHGLTVDGALTRRRIESLYFLGHTQEEIASAAGLTASRLSCHGTRTRKWYASRIRDAYEALSGTTGSCSWVRWYARSRGAQPPAAWDDPGTLEWPEGWEQDEMPTEVAVDLVAIRRRMAGEHDVRLTKEERLLLVQIMLEEGHSTTAAARVLQVSGTTIKKMSESVRQGDQWNPCDTLVAATLESHSSREGTP